MRTHGKPSTYTNGKCRCDLCTDAHNKYQKIQRKKNPEKVEKQRKRSELRYHQRQDYVNEIKLRLGCTDCGYKEHPAALDFDHVTNTKTANVSKMMFYTMEKLTNEINKCEVVCSNCHRIRTTKRKSV